jgi:hypothetical protein
LTEGVRNNHRNASSRDRSSPSGDGVDDTTAAIIEADDDDDDDDAEEFGGAEEEEDDDDDDDCGAPWDEEYPPEVDPDGRATPEDEEGEGEEEEEEEEEEGAEELEGWWDGIGVPVGSGVDRTVPCCVG